LRKEFGTRELKKEQTGFPEFLSSKLKLFGTKTAFICAGSVPMMLLTKDGPVAILAQNLIRVTARFFSGVLHPHLLGVCCPNLFFFAAIPRTRLTGWSVFTTLPPRLARGRSSIG
jgi:hypothetical protein